MRIQLTLFALLSIVIASLLLEFNFGSSTWSSPNLTFNVTPDTLYLNWTTDYAGNITIQANSIVSYWFNVTVVNSTLNFNYTTSESCQAFPCSNLLVKNATGSEYITTSNNITGGNTSNLTLIKTLANPFSGRSRASIRIYNTSNSTENLNMTVFLDYPIQVNALNGMGIFNGTLPINASAYHSFYFNTSSVPNATGVYINLTSSQDVDLFLFDNSTTQVLKGKSINKDSNAEDILYNFLPANLGMWELRVYGNYTSPITYNGNLFFTTLNLTNASTGSTISSINFTVMNSSSTAQANITLKNEGNLTLTGVTETKSIYYVKRFTGSSNSSFTFLVPDSSIASRVKVSLNWTGGANYSLNLYKPDGTLVASSTNKYPFASVSGAESGEYNETTNITAGYWTVEVRNNTSTNNSPFDLTIKIYPTNSSSWFNSTYPTSGFTFNTTGSTNSTYTFQLNFIVQNTTLDGAYEGYVEYDDQNAAILVPIKVNITTPVLVVNQTVNSSTVRINENINASLTKILNITINNTGTVALSSIAATNSSSLNYSSYHIDFVSIQSPSSLSAGSSSMVNISLNLSTNTTNNQPGVYKGWIFFNTSTSQYPSHPYDFNLSIELNLTNSLNVTAKAVTENNLNPNVINVSTSAQNATVTLNLNYINGTQITGNFPLSVYSYDGLRNITNIRLYEGNASYWIPNSTGPLTKTSLGVPENTSNPGDYWFNITIPASQPGGLYEVHVNAVTLDGTLSGESSNKVLVINDTGLYMSTSDSLSSTDTSTDVYYNVTVKNFGPLAASSKTITFYDNNCSYVTATVYDDSCGGNTGYAYTSISLSGYNLTGCWVRWKIHPDGNGSCSGMYVNGADYTWFNNITGLSITVGPTTTTTISGGNNPGNINFTTSTTRTTTTTRNGTTTTTVPVVPQNETLNISRITPGTPAVFRISNPEVLKIQQVVLAVNKNVSNVAITVKEAVHPAGAPNVTDPKSGLIFKYLDISVTNVSASDIANVTIKFQVEKNWVNLNGIDASTIILYRYFNNSWRTLPTIKINETTVILNFQSISPGLSVFAIAGQKAKAFPFLIIIAVVVVVVAVVLAYLFWPVKTEKETKEDTGTYLAEEEKKGEEKKEEKEDAIEKLKEKWAKLSKQKK